ncbi:MAG: ATP-binding cassette domain-containing protein [Candidatus Humimicrobiaceae bacterium]
MDNIDKKVLLKIEHISKNFGSVTALQDINFEIYENEIVAIVGDNGAGKSTLIKIISGNFSPDNGEIFFDGKKIILKSPSDARKLGIETVYQDLSICNNLDSVANLYIGREIYKNILGLRVLNIREMKAKALRTLGSVGINIPSVDEKVEYLSGGQRQAVILARFLEWGKRLILLDEPTAALGVRETKQVLELVRKTKAERKEASFVLISHNLQQVFEIADRIIVLRLGKVIGIRETLKTNSDEIVSLITGSIFINSNKSN